MTVGQKEYSGHWYLFDKELCNEVSNTLLIKVRQFTTTKMVGCYMAGKIRQVYYNKDGWMLYGHQLINGKKYYFNTITGAKE